MVLYVEGAGKKAHFLKFWTVLQDPGLVYNTFSMIWNDNTNNPAPKINTSP